MRFDLIDSPVGRLLLVCDDDGITEIRFSSADLPPPPDADWEHDPAGLRVLAAQLREYFAATRTEFDIPLRPSGTEFQRQVWDALVAIPYGETISYGELAARIGRPSASRAVGLANGANPLPIVVPCHRVVGADGSLTGFGGGLDRKRFLLGLEGAAAGHAVRDQARLF